MTLSDGLYGRTAALTALGIGVAGAIGLLVFAAFLFIGAENDATADTVHALAAARAEAAARPQVAAALARFRAQVQSMPGLIHGGDDAQAGASLQNAVKDIVTGNGGEIRSAQALPATKAAGFEVVSVQYDLTVPVNKLRDLTYAVETHTPYLFIDTADITAPISWDPKSAAVPTLEVRWVLRAYRWAEEK